MSHVSGRKVAPAHSTLYVPKDQLEAWFLKASEGAKRVYARGPGLDQKEAVCILVRDWASTGEVDLVQMRDQETRELLYYVRRKRPVVREAGADRRRVQVDDQFRETPEGRIFLMLVRAANLGRPCPSNAELAEFAGLETAEQARYLLREKLVKPGLVELHHVGAGNAQRRAKIVETGRWTADIKENGR
ncbi:hypothetical protein Saro_0637 [Novosphingobium aromaticivorans DSM 12444]|uniref:Uncharacterized protein n=1 Tax=Novosphingobium aromaticivorans (strain ATCC 700278 / DSM 12444 / CCUG 56034 / CIP 105152 / NBRC 16084 / F199) TaxID=279238 RepID=Q2GAN9_NOVAD|nr:hypothetical protein [Novosphingobium aromaticivorans]ABD25084.1 hypothetical protein Saro_0637 [Novosphingobium aromaticivorans DSM 12444]SCY96045.1 hypothetical protein SAMN05660666_03898 [Novosphingobium aromaticivorans]